MIKIYLNNFKEFHLGLLFVNYKDCFVTSIGFLIFTIELEFEK